MPPEAPRFTPSIPAGTAFPQEKEAPLRNPSLGPNAIDPLLTKILNGRGM